MTGFVLLGTGSASGEISGLETEIVDLETADLETETGGLAEADAFSLPDYPEIAASVEPNVFEGGVAEALFSQSTLAPALDARRPAIEKSLQTESPGLKLRTEWYWYLEDKNWMREDKG